MADELQALLDRITEDGLQKSEAERDKILSAAKAEAEAIRRQAQEDAARLKSEAEKESDLLRVKSEQALQQAARDVKLSLQESLKQSVTTAVRNLMQSALGQANLPQIIAQVCASYLQSNGNEERLEVLVPAASLEALTAAVKAQMVEELRQRCELSPSRHLQGGFQVTIKGSDVTYDFSDKALTEALSEHLSPRLAAILSEDQG